MLPTRTVVLDAMVIGRVCFHIENAGMGGMGWDGKGRDVMGWEWGWGEVCHAMWTKVGKK